VADLTKSADRYQNKSIITGEGGGDNNNNKPLLLF